MAEISDGLSTEQLKKHNEGWHPIPSNDTENVLRAVKRDIDFEEELFPGLYPKEFYGSHYPLKNSQIKGEN